MKTPKFPSPAGRVRLIKSGAEGEGKSPQYCGGGFVFRIHEHADASGEFGHAGDPAQRLHEQGLSISAALLSPRDVTDWSGLSLAVVFV